MGPDPRAGSPWSQPAMVAGFRSSLPNATLMQFAADRLRAAGGVGRALDLGCGAGRNAIPLALQGWNVLGVDLSVPMLQAAAARVGEDAPGARIQLARSPMDALPAGDGAFDLVIAHGIWNLARAATEFRRALREAARATAAGGALFVFTFSRNTFPPDTAPVDGEPFVYTQFAGEPQCFLTADQLLAELAAAGFVPDPAVPLRELNRPAPGTIRAGGPPVILEAAFRYAPGSGALAV